MDTSKQNLSLKDLEVKRAKVNGSDIRYVEKGSGEPVVFVHGAVTDLRIWLGQVELLSEKYRAISYSRRTHWPGLANGSDVPYTRKLHSDDLLELLRGLDFEKAHLVGHSFGASVALLAALEQPDRIASLTLGEPSPFLSLLEQADFDLIAKQKGVFDKAMLVAEVTSADAAVRQFLSEIVGADVLDQLPRDVRTIVLDNAASLRPMLSHYYESPPIGPERWNDLEMPVLLISGELSPKASSIGNERLHRCIPGSRWETLASASHGLHIEDPDQFGRLLTNFLSEVGVNARGAA